MVVLGLLEVDNGFCFHRICKYIEVCFKTHNFPEAENVFPSFEIFTDTKTRLVCSFG